LPVAFEVTAGQRHDSQSALSLIATVDPKCLLGDKAYDADAIREDLHARDAVAVIPPKANRKAPAAFDKELYKARSAVECTFQLAQTGSPFCDALREDVAQLRRGGRHRLRLALAANLTG
jgi:transposase